MASWKKVIVSGSTANLSALQVDNLTSGSVVIGGGAGSNLTATAINGSGNIVATTGATGLVHTGSFTGSFSGALTSTLTNASQPNIVGYDTNTGTFSYQGTGSFTATSASFASTASYVPTAIVTASAVNTTITFTRFNGTTFDVTVSQSGSVASASYAQNADLLDGKDSTEFTLTSSFNSYTSSANSSIQALTNATSSYTLNSQTSSFVQNSQTGAFATFTALNDFHRF